MYDPYTSRGHNCIPSSDSLQGPFSKAMVISRVMRGHQGLWKSHGASTVLWAARQAASEAGRHAGPQARPANRRTTSSLLPQPESDAGG